MKSIKMESSKEFPVQKTDLYPGESPREHLGSAFIRSRTWTLLTAALVLIGLAVILLTFQDYGITYDEDWRSTYAENIIHWYSSGFKDQAALNDWIMIDQGGGFSIFLRLATRISPLGDFETGHLLLALFSLVGVVYTYRLGASLANPFTGFLAALFLFLTPRFYGDAFSNQADIPFAVLSTIILYYLVRAIFVLPKIPARLALSLGICLGLALAIRANTILWVAYLGLALTLWLALQIWKRKGDSSSKRDIRSALIQISRSFLGICALAYIVMSLLWPAALVQPFYRPAKALLYTYRTLKELNQFNVYFHGVNYLATNLPSSYVPQWFLITLPEFYILGLAAAGSVLLAKLFASGSQNGPANTIPSSLNQRTIAWLILWIVIIFPLAMAAITSPLEYDGLRHYLFVLPLLAVLSANGVAAFFDRFSPTASAGLTLVIFISLGLTIFDLVRLHPDQYIYFNRLFAGGVANASRNYETDYWGNSFKEGVEWVVKNYHVPNSPQKVKVASCLYSLSTSYYLTDPRFEYIGSFHDGQRINGEPDLFLASPRWDCDKKLPGKVLHTVTRMGAPLLYVIEVSKSTVGP